MKLWFAGHSSHGLTTAMVDVYDEIVESDENNNGRSQQLAIPTLPPPCPPTATATPTPLPPDTSLPDLIITWVWFDLNTGGSCTLPESEVGLRVYISNIGNADASAFSVKLNDEFQRVEHGLAEGEKTTLWFYQYAVPGSFSHAVVDANDEVQEINESNNEFEVQLPALTPALPCTATPTNTPGSPTPTLTPTWTPSP
jgi:subtilase family serine protease